MATTTPYLDTVQLPEDTYWMDEFDHNPVVLDQKYTIGGKLLVESAIKLGGRPITLQLTWIDLTTLRALEALRDAVGQYTLTLVDTRQYTVMFSGDQVPIQVEPVVPRPDWEVGPDWFDVTLRLIEVV